MLEDATRPVVLHSAAANCGQPDVKKFKPHDNSQYNNLRSRMCGETSERDSNHVVGGHDAAVVVLDLVLARR